MIISLFILDIVNEQLETIDSDYNIYPKKTEEKISNIFDRLKKDSCFHVLIQHLCFYMLIKIHFRNK